MFILSPFASNEAPVIGLAVVMTEAAALKCLDDPTNQCKSFMLI